MHKYIGIIGVIGSLLVGCNQKTEGAKADPTPAPPAKSAQAVATQAAPESPAPAAATGAAATASAAALPAGRSPTPTLDEWKGVTREVTVKGSSALGCETKMVREYLRVSCRGKNDSGGTPKHIVLQKGVVENHIFVDREVMSLVVPFVEGINATFLFSWSDKTHPLVLKWSRGSAKPVIIGTFEGAKSPLDGTAIDKDLAARCRSVYGYQEDEISVEDMWSLLTLNKHCMTTYRNDCSKLKDCNFGEPWAPVKCPSNTVPMLNHFCLQRCNADRSCPAGSSCMDDDQGIPLCVDD